MMHRYLRGIGLRHVSNTCLLKLKLIVIEAACQSIVRHVLYCWHMRQSSCCKRVLQSTHIAAASVSVLPVEEIVDRDCVMTGHRRIVFPVASMYYFALLYVVHKNS